jgi:urease accessory protein
VTRAPARGLRARTTVVVERGGVLRELRCEPPLTIRRVHSPAGECGLCQVGTAAGPLPGDDLRLSLDIGPDARASLVSAGASIALGRSGSDPSGSDPDHGAEARRPAELRTAVAVAGGGQLTAEPAPLVVARGADVEVGVRIALEPGASVQWRELIVLGRTGERAGRVRLHWDVTCDGLPLLRQTIDLADPALAGWPAMLHNGSVLATALLAGPQVKARTIVASRTAVAQQLDEDAVLVSVLSSDAAAAQAQLADLLAELA